MAQTRAQRGAQRRRNEEDHDQDASTRKRQRRAAHHKTSTEGLRKRAVEDIHDLHPNPSSKRRQISKPSAEDTFAEAVIRDPNCPIGFWTREGTWPREYIKIDAEQMEHAHALARKRSSSSLRRKRSDSGTSATPSDQKPREEKCAQYRDPRYKILLATKGSFMDKSDLGIDDTSKKACKSLLSTEQATPNESLFRDDLFEQTCRGVEDRNEARVIRDITPLIVPAAEILTIYGSTSLKCLIESTNEGWNNSIPLTGTRPQPDYSVGFRREAFSDDQLAKLSPFIGDFIAGDLSFFMATYYMYFPFLSCEVKCGAAALDVADRQNAHSMTLAVRAIVELFRLAKRENEVHRQILSFSISHDHRSVRIYGYYPVIDGKDTKYYRHPIHMFDFTALDGKDKWTTYKFIKNIYDTWMPGHFKRICSAMGQLPSVDFDNMPALSESTSLSQGMENLGRSEDSASLLGDEGNKSRQIDTPNTSISKPAPGKRRKSPVKKSRNPQ